MINLEMLIRHVKNSIKKDTNIKINRIIKLVIIINIVEPMNKWINMIGI